MSRFDNAERNRKIVDLRGKKMLCAAIAERFGLSERAVQQILRLDRRRKSDARSGIIEK